jgi:GNAT superfamily N-acetyltransferase
MPELKRIAHADLGQITSLLKQQSPWTKVPSRQEVEQALQNTLFHLLVLQENDEYLGMGSIFFQRNLSHWMAEVHDVVVDEKYRGAGYGRIVMNGILDTASEFSRQQEAHIHLYLTSRPSRIAANQLYRKLGFELIAQSTGERGTNLYRMIIEP